MHYWSLILSFNPLPPFLFSLFKNTEIQLTLKKNTIAHLSVKLWKIFLSNSVSGKWLGLLSTKQAFSHQILKISQFTLIVDQTNI